MVKRVYRVISLQPLELPRTVHAVTVKASDRQYNVYVNKDCERPMEAVIRHERRHIEGGHFEHGLEIEHVERLAEEPDVPDGSEDGA